MTAWSAADVSVVIVSHNNAPDLPACLQSLAGESPAAVVVVDNASADDSVEVARRGGARVVARSDNGGYSVAVNCGVAETHTPVVVILNPDSTVVPGALGHLAAVLAGAPAVGAVGPQVRNPDGTVYPSRRTFPSVWTAAAHGFLGLFWRDNPLSRRYRMADDDTDTPRVVDWVSGSAMAVRREAFDSVAGFDPGYFLYVEDVDFCWRLWQEGWVVAYHPGAAVVHVGGTSSSARPYSLLVEHHRSMLRFELVRRRGRRGLTWPVVVAGVWARAATALAVRAATGPPPQLRGGRAWRVAEERPLRRSELAERSRRGATARPMGKAAGW